MGSGTVAAIVLAAGLSRRWGAENKLLAPVAGLPMVRRTVDAVLGSIARPVTIVLGHEQDRIAAALAGCDAALLRIDDYGLGLSATLKAGIGALPDAAVGALICLADMPWVRPETLNRLIADFVAAQDKVAAVPVFAGEWGNPVLLGRALFGAVQGLEGDRGARSLLGTRTAELLEVPVADPGVLRDADIPAALDS